MTEGNGQSGSEVTKAVLAHADLVALRDANSWEEAVPVIVQALARVPVDERMEAMGMRSAPHKVTVHGDVMMGATSAAAAEKRYVRAWIVREDDGA